MTTAGSARDLEVESPGQPEQRVQGGHNLFNGRDTTKINSSQKASKLNGIVSSRMPGNKESTALEKDAV